MTPAIMKVNTSLNNRTLRPRKPFLMKANEQYCLDFGQKNIDPIKCATCGMLYVVGEESDEKQHAKYHAQFDEGVRWSSKLERPKKYFDDCSRIIAITSNEQKPIYDTINKLLKMSDGEMSAGNDITKIIKDPRIFLLYIDRTNHILGYICAEPITEAFNLIDYEASRLEDEPTQAECGVLYLWVHPSFRRRKIATKLVDVARANIRKDRLAYRTRVAVCDPTEQAVPFFQRYLLNRRPVKVYQQNSS